VPPGFGFSSGSAYALSVAETRALLEQLGFSVA
jgi:hypothetical protein